jgi:uncharacterized protein YraI
MRKHLAVSVVSGCLVLCSVFPLRSALSTFNQSPPTSGTINANANLRARPHTNYAKVGFAPLGTPVQIAACTAGFCRRDVQQGTLAERSAC